MAAKRARVQVGEVRVHRVHDEDPDLSHFGEYSNHWKEGAIDRKESLIALGVSAKAAAAAIADATEAEDR